MLIIIIKFMSALIVNQLQFNIIDSILYKGLKWYVIHSHNFEGASDVVMNIFFMLSKQFFICIYNNGYDEL